MEKERSSGIGKREILIVIAIATCCIYGVTTSVIEKNEKLTRVNNEYQKSFEQISQLSEGHKFVIENFDSCVTIGKRRMYEYLFECVNYTKNISEAYGHGEAFSDVVVRMDLAKRIREGEI